MTGVRIGPIIVGALIGNTIGVLAYMALAGRLPWWPLAAFVAVCFGFAHWYTSEAHAWRAARRAYQRRTKENT